MVWCWFGKVAVLPLCNGTSCHAEATSSLLFHGSCQGCPGVKLGCTSSITQLHGAVLGISQVQALGPLFGSIVCVLAGGCFSLL